MQATYLSSSEKPAETQIIFQGLNSILGFRFLHFKTLPFLILLKLFLAFIPCNASEIKLQNSQEANRVIELAKTGAATI